MKRLSSRPILALLLSLLLALGTGLSVVQAAEMGTQMAMASDMGGGDCAGCGGGDDGVMPDGCVAACSASLLGVLPQTLFLGTAVVPDLPSFGQTIAEGRAHSPSPHPPQTRLIG